MTPLTRIQGYAHVAQRYGLEEAIFLDAIVHWYRVNRADDRNFHEGRWWTYNTVAAFEQTFPWWSAKQLRRIIKSCKDQGALLTCTCNKDSRDRTIWYSPSDELLELYGDSQTGKCICPNGQMEVPERANECAQMGKALPCNNHVDTHDPPLNPPQGGQCRRTAKKEPDWEPERFARFWSYYPRGENKQAAIRAWDKLQPSSELIDTMAQALKRQVASEGWRQGIGIPYASTWLNGRRWEDELKFPDSGLAPPDRVIEEEGVHYL